MITQGQSNLPVGQVLIFGMPGSGKSVLQQAMHPCSPLICDTDFLWPLFGSDKVWELPYGDRLDHYQDDVVLTARYLVDKGYSLITNMLEIPIQRKFDYGFYRTLEDCQFEWRKRAQMEFPYDREGREAKFKIAEEVIPRWYDHGFIDRVIERSEHAIKLERNQYISHILAPDAVLDLKR